MRSAAVVIVGGGVMGASAAYHLAARGWRDIVVVDRGERPGTGSTGRATGGFRAQFSTHINVRLSLLAREKLRGFEAETGVDPEYTPAGYLWLARTGNELATLREALAIQREAGLAESREVSVAEASALSPAVRMEGVVGGCFCPTDGFIRPLRILEGYMAAATRLGARFDWGVEVTGFGRAGSRITHVPTSQDPITCERVVNAAGPWAGIVASWAGAELPVAPLRRQVAATVPTDLLPPTMPMTIFAGDGFHFRVRDGRVLLLYATPGVPGRPFDDSVDARWVEDVWAMARERIPVLAGASIDPSACHAGLYEMTPDKHSVLGAAPECSNLYYINGSSGHGVMHSLALGQLLAEIVIDGQATTLDVAELAVTRFGEGKLNRSSELL